LPAIFRAAAEIENVGKMPALRLPVCLALDSWIGFNRDANPPNARFRSGFPRLDG
jgi:hypothetical protein